MKEDLNIAPEAWIQYFNYAKSYYEENGNLKIAQARRVNGIPLGRWLYLQKVAYKNGKLSEKQIKLLESIGFVWNAQKSQWEKKFREAKAYYEAHGNLCVPSGYSSNGISLGLWVTSQRVAYKRNRLTQEKIDILESIGMDWENDEKMSVRWEEKYAVAKAYYEEYGHLKVNEGYKINGVSLYSWLRRQIALYKKGELSNEKIEKLEKIGIVWSNSDLWEANFTLAEKYFKEFGNLIVPRTCVYENSKLGYWINSQRVAYKQKTLSESKIKRLEEIGMVWNIITLKWEDYYNIAKKHHKEHGNLIISGSYEIDGINIGSWILYQRAAYKKGYLSEERYKLLEKIDMIWDFKEWQWNQSFVLAKEYYEEYGNLHINGKYEKNGYKVGKWIATQRLSYSKGELSEERIKRLNEIGMLWSIRER